MKKKKSQEEPKPKRWAMTHYIKGDVAYPPSKEPEILAYVNYTKREKYGFEWKGRRIPASEPYRWHTSYHSQEAIDWLIWERLNNDPVLKSLGIRCLNIDTDRNSLRADIKKRPWPYMEDYSLAEGEIFELSKYPQPVEASSEMFDLELPPLRQENGNNICGEARTKMASAVAVAERKLEESAQLLELA